MTETVTKKTRFNIEDTNVRDLTNEQLQQLLGGISKLGQRVAKREIARREKEQAELKSRTGSQDFRKGGMVLSTVDNRKNK
jgi:hypothetical protein